MKMAVVLRQVPDLVEPLEIADGSAELDLDDASFILNETDDHALEQALLLKESVGAAVAVVALDWGDVDKTLYSAAARGADRILKIPCGDAVPQPAAAAAQLADAVMALEADLVLIGCQAHDELEGALGPRLAHALGLPCVGVVRGVQVEEGGRAVRVFKEFPGAVRARMRVELPALLGILAADEPPRYVPVSRIRAAMKSAQFELHEAELPDVEPLVTVTRLRAPEPQRRAEIIEGSDDDVAARLAGILREKGMVT